MFFRPSPKRNKVNIPAEAYNSPSTSAYLPFVLSDDDTTVSEVDDVGVEPCDKKKCEDGDYDPNISFLEYGAVDDMEDVEFAETSKGEVR